MFTQQKMSKQLKKILIKEEPSYFNDATDFAHTFHLVNVETFKWS